ncbi:hypothetical protein [Aeromonas caviae]|uniref:hypothetical protein n=1 Tax=Aeromonas caviae TaxID=648 RepID=UPI00111B2EE3|nr:hypothetical protein [Aeromonas caviae]
MKPIEKNKVQKTIEKIESGCFDDNDIDNLLIKLRAYSAGFHVFKEVADFVAHNDQRDRGLACNSLRTLYLSVKFFAEYNSKNKMVDITSPFPIWIKDLMKLQVKKCNEATLIKEFNVSRKTLVKFIEKEFNEDRVNNLASCKPYGVSIEKLKAINYVMSFIYGTPSFSQNEIVDEIVSVLKVNKIKFNEKTIRGFSDKIAICILLLFHKAEFYFDGGVNGRCEISSDSNFILHSEGVSTKGGNGFDSTGDLLISGTIDWTNDSQSLSLSYPIMITNLSSKDWCSDEIFNTSALQRDRLGTVYRTINSDADLCLNEEFKLSKVRT